MTAFDAPTMLAAVDVNITYRGASGTEQLWISDIYRFLIAGIAGAVAAGPGLPSDAGTALLTSARAAFTDGLHTIAIVSVVIFLALAAVARIGLGHLPALGDMPMPGMPAESDRTVEDRR